jgi:hypothetical protein
MTGSGRRRRNERERCSPHPGGGATVSASHGRRPPQAEAELRELLGHLEARAQRLRGSGEEGTGRGQRLSPPELEELRRAWHRYCEVIAELGEGATEAEPPSRS